MFALVDCDSFFVSCEMLRNSSLRNRPTVILSNNDACIISASREAKSLGFKIGMPLFKMQHIVKSHHVATISSDFSYYGKKSQEVMTCLEECCPQMEVYSIDEAFLSMKGLPLEELSLHGHRIRSTLLKTVGIPVSIGFAPTMTLAKVATSYAKDRLFPPYPHIYVLSPQDIDHKLQSFPVQDVWGIGRRLSSKLISQGIMTAALLIKQPSSWIQKYMGGVVGQRLVQELKGIPCHALNSSPKTRKSLLVSRSFQKNIFCFDDLMSAIATFTARGGEKLRRRHLLASHLAVFARTSVHSDYCYRGYEVTHFLEATNDTKQLILAAKKLTEILYQPNIPFRKAGICLFNLSESTSLQPCLFMNEIARKRQYSLNQTMDYLNTRFGHGAIKYGAEIMNETHSTAKKQIGKTEHQFTDLNLRFH